MHNILTSKQTDKEINSSPLTGRGVIDKEKREKYVTVMMIVQCTTWNNEKTTSQTKKTEEKRKTSN